MGSSDAALLLALTPSVQELADWKGVSVEEEFGTELASVETHLKLAAALFLLASDLTTIPPANTSIGILVRHGILDMAWYIGTSLEDRDAMFSPFSSERIGSYSYSKAARAVSNKEETGVPFFDLALKYLGRDDEQAAEDLFSVDSEHVFHSPYQRSNVAVEEIPDRVVQWTSPDDGKTGREVDPFSYVELFESGE